MNKGILITAALALAASMAMAQHKVPVNLPEPEPGHYVHTAPTMEQLQADENIHPELRKAIMRGYDLFMNTQQLRGKHVFSDMNCVSCHMGEGRMAWASPVWPTMTTLPDYRGKNWQVNSVEDRMSGCFSFSMNGIPPDYDSDIMVALIAYQQWTARGAPVYEWNIAGRGFGEVADPPKEPDYKRGEKVFADNCALCHGSEGQGQYVDGAMQFPSVWGDHSYNWGAGMSRVDTAAAFIKHNMPLGQPGKLSDQDAWDVAYFVSAQERPQDPRYEKSAKHTREKYNNFHSRTLYGTKVNGRMLGEHTNTGEKPILKPEALSRERKFD